MAAVPGATDRAPVTRAGRRGKIVYKLTPDGKEHFQELLDDAGPASWEDETFGVHLAFFGQTDREVRMRILEGRRSRLEERRDGAKTAIQRARERLDEYTLELQRHGLESVEREVRWLTELIDTEHNRPVPVESDRPPDRRRHSVGDATAMIDDTAPPPPPHRPRTDPRTTPSYISESDHHMGSVRVAIVGVGNCAASLVQGVHYYADADPAARVPGLMHVQFGPYHVRDIEFVAAFDVDAKKVGRDLSEAIVASENNTIKICDVPPLNVTVQRGHTLRRPR